MHHDPYRPLPTPPEPPRITYAWSSMFVLAWVVVGSVVMMVISHMQPYIGRAEQFVVASVVTLLGTVAAAGVWAMHRGNARRGHLPQVGAWLATAAVPIGMVLSWLGAFLVHTAAYVPSYMGRRHRKGSTLFVPSTQAGAEWVEPLVSLDPSCVPAAERAALAAEWRDNGRKEHASVAAFAQLSLDLMAVGAPPGLVADAHRAALDEVAHAATCFAIAHAIDGQALSPAAFPDARTQRWLCRSSRTVALTQMAIAALADGVLNEGIAARLLARLAAVATLPGLGERLRTMAADESRHAAHSWNVVEFCLGSGGPAVRAALRGALEGMPRRVCSALPEGARDGAWVTWGVQSEGMEAEAYAKTRRSTERKLRGLLEAKPSARLAA